MKRLLLALAVGIWLPSFGLTASLPEQAEQAWSQRADPKQLDAAIALWQQALQSNPQQTKIYVSLTKACGRAYRHATTDAERKRWADQALTFGKEAIAKNPGDSNAWAAYAEALGQSAQAHKGLHSLGLVKEAVAALQKAVEINPANGYAHMLLSQFYGRSPSSISVGDKTKSLAEAKLAVQYDPTHSISYLTLAEALKENGQKDASIDALKKVLALPTPMDAVPETHSDQTTARELLTGYGVSVPKETAANDGACVATPNATAGDTGSCTQAPPP